MHLVLAPLALAEPADIRDRTMFDWGPQQSRRYVEGLVRVWTMRLEQPQAGRARPELGSETPTIPVGSQVLVYENAGDALNILAIPHQSEDPAAYLA
jgi:toxin ParE1/3/4